MPVWSTIDYRGDPADLLVAIEDLRELLTRPSWHAQAACHGQGTARFFPELGATAEEARPVCAGCPVRQPCLEAGLADPRAQGVWGGTTFTERRRLRRTAAASGGSTEKGPAATPSRWPAAVTRA